MLSLLITELAGAACMPSPEIGSAGTCSPATPDNWYWTNDTRLTDDIIPDGLPALAVDGSGNAFITWDRSGQYMFKKVDRLGNLLLAERRMVPGTLPLQHVGQPCERIGADSHDNIHIVYANTSQNDPAYRKFNSSGAPAGPPLTLTYFASAPHSLSLAVGRNDRAYLAYEDQQDHNIRLAIVSANGEFAANRIVASNGAGVTICLDSKNRPHVFYKSDDTPGLWMSIFSADGAPLQNQTQIPSPVNGSGLESPMTAVTIGGDGAIHLLQASDISGRRTLYYSKLSDNGTKLVNDTVVTHNATDFGDISVDSRGRVFCAWGDLDDGQLYYLTISPGKENDTLVAVRLTSGSVNARDPQVAADRRDRIHVVWADGRDGNSEIYYKCSYSLGVGLTMPTTEIYRMSSIHCNETRRANFTLQNTGDLNDTFNLSLDVDLHGHPGGVGANYTGGGWKIWLDEQSTVFDLQPNQTIRLRISVRGSSTGRSGDYIDIRMLASSANNPNRNGTIAFRTYLTVNERLSLSCPDKVHSSLPGTPTVYTIFLNNLGDIEENVGLAAKGSPNWQFALNRDVVRMKAKESVNISLTVTPPQNAYGNEDGIVVLTGFSVQNPEVKDTVTIHSIVRPTLDLGITADHDLEYIDPGGSASYVITVCNNGNMAEHTRIDLETNGSDGSWDLSLDAQTVEVGGGGSSWVTLRVTAPAYAPAGSINMATVRCSNNEMTVTAECTVTTVVQPYHNLTIDVVPGSVTVEAGWSAAYWLVIANNGNIVEEVRPGPFEVPPGWYIWFQGQDGRLLADNDPLRIDMQGTENVSVVVTIGFGSLAGTYRIKGAMLDKAGNPYPVELVTNVAQVYDIELNASPPMQISPPGKTVSFTLVASNWGNGRDLVALGAAGLPPEWMPAAFYDGDKAFNGRLGINASHKGIVTVRVKVPAITSLHSANFSVTARSAGGLSRTVQLAIEITRADLAIRNVELSTPAISAGKAVIVKVTVKNLGTAVAENVTLGHHRDRVMQPVLELGTILPGGERVETFTWIPHHGKNILKYEVDPGDQICEDDESNNAMSVEKNIYKDAASVPRNGSWAAPIAVIATLATIMFLLARRQPRMPRSPGKG